MTKINRLTFFITVFLCFFIPFREIIALYTIDFIKFLPDLIVWPFAALIIVKNKFKINLKLYDWAFLAFITSGLISTLINSTSLLAFALQVRSIFTMYVFFYVLRNTEFSEKQINYIKNILLLVLSVIIVFALLEHFTYKFIFPEVWRANINHASNYARVYSLMNNPNSFAFFSYMVMLLVYFTNKGQNKLLHYGFYTLVFLSILLSASRSTFIAIAFLFLLLIFDTVKGKGFMPLLKMGLSLALALILMFASSPLKNLIYDVTDGFGAGFSGLDTDYKNPAKNNIAFLDRFGELSDDTILQNSSSDGRIFVIFKGLEIFMDHPIFGTGFGTYGSAGSQMVKPHLYEEYGLYENLYSDNEYIKVFVETGILGTLIYIAFIFLLLKTYFKNKYKIVALISFLFIGMFYNMFEMQTICFILYLILSYSDKGIGEQTSFNLNE